MLDNFLQDLFKKLSSEHSQSIIFSDSAIRGESDSKILEFMDLQNTSSSF